jgi:Arc/MetJ-type ribon-helix-helix transcriptional regulator
MAPASQFGQTKVTPTHLYNPDTKETKQVPDEMRKSVSESMRSHLRELLKLNEAKRGRKPKDGGDPGDEGSYVDPETGEKSAPPKKHIMNQLRQAAQSMKAQHPVTYADGSTHNVPKHVAKALVNAYQDPSKKPYEREAMQAKIGQSHKELMQHHSELNEDSYNPPNGKKKMLLEPGVDKKNKKELDEVPVETVKQVRMFQQDEEQAVSNRDEEPPFKPDAKRTKRPDEPTTARGLARAAMRRAMEKAKQNEEVNEVSSKSIDERHMSDSEMKKREDIVMGMKKDGGVAGFKKRYGDRWREVMYATATKQAMKEETPKGADGVKVEPEMPFQGSGGVQSTKV